MESAKPSNKGATTKPEGKPGGEAGQTPTSRILSGAPAPDASKAASGAPGAISTPPAGGAPKQMFVFQKPAGAPQGAAPAAGAAAPGASANANPNPSAAPAPTPVAAPNATPVANTPNPAAAAVGALAV